MSTKKLTKEERVARINLIAAITVAIIGLIGAVIAAIISSGNKKDNPLPIMSQEPTFVVSQSVSPNDTKCAYPPRYGFECGQSGWDKTSFYQNKAIQAVAITQFKNKDGISSDVLALTVDFTGSIEERKKQNRESGEAQVELNSFPPAGYETKTVDLHGLTVVAQIWAPEGSIGDQIHKNGIQLFIKDNNDKNCYGAWNNINQEKVWFRVSWQENNAQLCDTGFDSSKPKFLGVKIAVGDNSIWTTNNPLIFYLDDVNWQSP